ncbi:hypothetical protein SDRG_16236 [Saprolegnia diclina VS20]|uniref:WRKY transcription factor 19 n=1 Tax=Saprolegnia diclina (strain VS20) TaxID=1156394 RepID=T0PUP8_SAPDV|nr:hypothetical protein SDRG_16236 [Saprolegnia diclina VS20]EQC25936.1 hypothetical protein SDRG_16236 [Saprolegnia diclina VS20]|eukprot:XP_008620658.1 hypothetical protein SDRG_16236 [Saprolegnia diclina VS20]
MTSTECCFHGCIKTALAGSIKCHFHRNRTKCSVLECWNQVYARQRCVSHGGRKPCIVAGCNANARLGDLCGRHGIKSDKKICSMPGCASLVHTQQRCVRHGGGRSCRVQACGTLARAGGYCYRHGKQYQATASPCKSDHESPQLDGITWDARSMQISLGYEDNIDLSILDCLISDTMSDDILYNATFSV